jgi:citrate lyase subunit beta/citryl-CoA lyase
MIRSYLFIPGDSERKMARSTEFGADALILDLEDSVAPDRKPLAREMTRAYVQAASPSGPKLVIRCNSLGTGMVPLDLAAVVDTRPYAILLPKASGQADIDAVGHMLSALEAKAGMEVGAIGIIALVTETALAVLNMAAQRISHPRLLGVTWGAEDLASDIGAFANRDANGHFEETFRFARSVCLLSAAAAGLPAIDTVYVDIRNQAGLEEECRAARQAGFIGKFAIHPGQVEAINRLFSPSPEELDWARRVVQAFESSAGTGVTTLDGKMLDVPHLRLAKRLLAGG